MPGKQNLRIFSFPNYLTTYQNSRKKIKLKSDLLKANKIIESIQNNQIDNNEIKKLKDENMNLKNQLNIKNNEIQELRYKIIMLKMSRNIIKIK